jgi:MFS transporter, putative metabolite:H+ symporter
MTAALAWTYRQTAFWLGCTSVTAGVLLHMPMYAESLDGGHHMSDMPIGWDMILGMALIVLGVVAACYGALPERHRSLAEGHSAMRYEAPDETPLSPAHILTLIVLVVGLVIDTMKPATLGFVLPGLAREYGIERSHAALLPFVALTGTTVGSFVWGWLADVYGRRVSIILSTIMFIATSVCGAMPAFGWNLLMCFLMGASAGGMMPVVYTLLAEIMPPRSRSWVLVLVGGTGLVGGYLAASFVASVFEPAFGWRSLWLQGLPTGIALLLLAKFIPESPKFLAEQGRVEELKKLARRFGIVAKPLAADRGPSAAGVQGQINITIALVTAALAWSFVNFGLLLWLPSDLQERGYSPALASGIIAKSALIALPTVAVAAWLYSRWSSKWTLVGSILLTSIGLGGTLLVDEISSDPILVIAVVALLIIGSNAAIAVLLPYTAENYPLGVRGRATGLVAGSSKVGGVAVQTLALIGSIPSFGAAALVLIAPMTAAGFLVGYAGRETRGRSLRELESAGSA